MLQLSPGLEQFSPSFGLQGRSCLALSASSKVSMGKVSLTLHALHSHPPKPYFFPGFSNAPRVSLMARLELCGFAHFRSILVKNQLLLLRDGLWKPCWFLTALIPHCHSRLDYLWAVMDALKGTNKAIKSLPRFNQHLLNVLNHPGPEMCCFLNLERCDCLKPLHVLIKSS